jgi:hypothetical protein
LGIIFDKGKVMNGKAKLFMSILGLGAVLTALPAVAQEKSAPLSEILFKIQDVTPEKNADGSVKYCSLRATFVNHTSVDVVNAALALTWHDDVIGDAIDAEERVANEAKRSGSQEASPRYSTAGFTSKSVQASLKLPPLKSGQQISLKTNVATDRCFLLLNDMDINVTNCGSADMVDKGSRQGCSDLFRYVSPKNEEYYVEFSDVTPQQQQAAETSQLNELKEKIDTAYSDALASIQAITEDKNEPEQKSEE